MPTLTQISQFLDNLFAPLSCHDHSNNGLQVEGRAEVRTIAFAVDACLLSFQQAAEANADLLVVHHGLSWGHGFQRLTDRNAKRFRQLFTTGLSLYACHLPLDAHPQYGNNAVLADMLKLQDRKPFFNYDGLDIGFYGTLPQPVTAEKLAADLNQKLRTNTTIVRTPGATLKPLSRLGIVSGGGAEAVDDCAKLGLDGLLTGEIGHQDIHSAWENQVTVLAAGHYATETTGVSALKKLLAEQFSVDTVFLDIPTGF